MANPIEIINSSDTIQMEALFKSLYFIINIFVLVINVGLSLLINFVAYKKRRRNERLYQENQIFYKTLIVERINDHIAIANEYNNIISETYRYLKLVNFKKDKPDYRSAIENASDAIDRASEKYINDYLILIRAYSIDFHTQLKREAEKLYDGVFFAIAGLSQDPAKGDEIKRKYSDRKKKYIEKFFVLVREFKPRID